MIVTEFRTDEVPVTERFEYFCSAASGPAPTLVRSEVADFRASVRVLDLGAAEICSLYYPPLESDRPRKLIRESDPEWLQLFLNVRGSQRIVHGGQDTKTGAGEFYLCDTSHPWQGWAHAEAGSLETIKVRLPRALLPLPVDAVGPLMAVGLSGRVGVEALLVDFLTRTVADADSFTPDDGPRLFSVLLDLMTALCAHHLNITRAAPPEALHHTLFLRICAFIDQHLNDPELTPATLATACQVSLRHLHRLFQAEGLTVGAHIRKRRLERCLRDLADPAHHQRPVYAIAASWGFTDPAHFSRVFRAAYGMPPGDYRHFAQPGQA